jgi:pimeloyl-ACP methyl ester carboxylesterase
MKIFFKDPVFDGQLLRALNHVYFGGADIGECLSTASRIHEGDTSQWHDEWSATAERINRLAEESYRKGHHQSAREAYLRASNYFRTAYIFLMRTPIDPRMPRAFDRQREAFRKAAALFLAPPEPLEIPFERGHLAGYFYRAGSDGSPRRTLIVNGGYDSTAEELYFFAAAAALRRGYNCLCFDGPGQGEAVIKRELYFRPDWENVIRPIVDYLLTRPDVDPDRIAMMGISFGGYLAPRAASAEPRLAALIADPGQFSLFEAAEQRVPTFLRGGLSGKSQLGGMILRRIFASMIGHPTRGWALRRGMFVHNASSPLDYINMTREYSLQGLAQKIACPTLVCTAEDDDIGAFAKVLFDALTCEKQFIAFTNAEGAGEHCEDGNRSLFHQRAFDWLDEVMENTRRRPGGPAQLR